MSKSKDNLTYRVTKHDGQRAVKVTNEYTLTWRDGETRRCHHEIVCWRDDDYLFVKSSANDDDSAADYHLPLLDPTEEWQREGLAQTWHNTAYKVLEGLTLGDTDTPIEDSQAQRLELFLRILRSLGVQSPPPEK